MKIDLKNLIPAAVMGIVFGAVIVAVLPYPMAAKRLPFIVGILGLALSLLVVISSLRPAKKEGKKKDEYYEGGDETVEGQSLMISLAWVAGILITCYLFGLLAGLSLYAFLYCKLHGGGWLGSILLGLGTAIFIYLIFVVLLDTILPKGLLLALFA